MALDIQGQVFDLHNDEGCPSLDEAKEAHASGLLFLATNYHKVFISVAVINSL